MTGWPTILWGCYKPHICSQRWVLSLLTSLSLLSASSVPSPMGTASSCGLTLHGCHLTTVSPEADFRSANFVLIFDLCPLPATPIAHILSINTHTHTHTHTQACCLLPAPPCRARAIPAFKSRSSLCTVVPCGARSDREAVPKDKGSQHH